jgi:hypothetical protein
VAHLTSIQTARHGISKQKESCDFWTLPGTLQRCGNCVIGNKKASQSSGKDLIHCCMSVPMKRR